MSAHPNVLHTMLSLAAVLAEALIVLVPFLGIIYQKWQVLMYVVLMYTVVIIILYRGIFVPCVRKSALCIWENKGADQLRSN